MQRRQGGWTKLFGIVLYSFLFKCHIILVNLKHLSLICVVCIIRCQMVWVRKTVYTELHLNIILIHSAMLLLFSHSVCSRKGFIWFLSDVRSSFSATDISQLVLLPSKNSCTMTSCANANSRNLYTEEQKVPLVWLAFLISGHNHSVKLLSDVNREERTYHLFSSAVVMS